MPGDDLAEGSLEQAVTAADRAYEAAKLRFEADLRHSESADRSWIAKRIILVFTASIAAALLVFGVEGSRTGQWWDVAQQAADLIRSDVLPIVTLILGYYFGRSGRS